MLFTRSTIILSTVELSTPSDPAFVLAQAKRNAGAAIRASAPDHAIRFPRLYRPDEIAAMPRIAFSKGVEAAWFVSREREGSRHYSQGVAFHAADAEPVVWQATSWDELMCCLSGAIRVVVTDAAGSKLPFLLEVGDYIWLPAGYQYSVESTGEEATSLVTTAPQMKSGWRYTGDDETYSDALVALRPGQETR
jgi:mannose-6-phosphate isomerase-like protein (cupin superfamily)